MVSGALIPERNGLSQFRENTGEPSVPVRESHSMPASLIELKNPFQTWIWTQADKSLQALWPINIGV